jgi:hypothetical protein
MSSRTTPAIKATTAASPARPVSRPVTGNVPAGAEVGSTAMVVVGSVGRRCWPGSTSANPYGEVAACYLAKELLRETYLADHVFDARRRLTVFYEHCVASEVPELGRLGRTIGRWEIPILRWHRTRLTNAATEAPTSS